MATGLIWIVFGILLILSELLATSVIAVFIGIGALVTGILLQMGIIISPTAQFIVFGVVSLASLILIRKHFKLWFVGFTKAQNDQQLQFQQTLGDRVVVKKNFQHGRGRVLLNGVEWDAKCVTEEVNGASCQHELLTGDVAWVIGNDGLTILISPTKPTN